VDFYVYMLVCRDGSFYVGHTDDLEQRMAAHHSGEYGGYTKSRRPVRLVWSDYFSSRDEAFQRERQIKGWSRAKKKALVQGDWASLVERSRNKQRGSI
jgi:predicted GIY-YIG superfamily endonuclease